MMTKFKQLRIAAGLTQIELAKQAHVKPGKIHAYETGTIDIASEPLSVAKRIAAALGVSVEDLIELDIDAGE